MMRRPTWYLRRFLRPLAGMPGLIILGAGLAASADEAGNPARRVSTTHDTEFTPSVEVVTPHVAVAHPAADALRIKALFVVWAPAARQVIELKQRMDFDFSFLGVGANNLLWRGSGQNNLSGATAEKEELARLNHLLGEAHDVIVLGSVPWTRYPGAVQNRILSLVEAGTGLVVTPYRHSYTHTSTGTGQLAELDKQAQPSKGIYPAEGARMATHGKGRIAFVDDPTYGGYYDSPIGGFLGRGQDRLEPFARTMLWAARRDPVAPIEPKVQISKNRVQVDGRPDGTVALYRDLDTAYPVLYGAMPYELRPYQSLEKVEPAAGPAAGPHDFRLAAGPYVLLEQLKDKAGKVLQWRQVAVKVPGDAQVDAIELHTPRGPVELTGKDALAWVRPGTPATLTIRVSGAPEKSTALVTLRDLEDRLVASANEAVAAGSFKTELDTRRAVHNLLVVTVTVRAPGGDPLAESRVPLLLDFAPPWRSPHRVRTFGTALMRPELTDNAIVYFPGYDISYPASLIMHAWADMTLNSFFGQSVFEKGRTTETFARQPSFFDPEYLDKQRNHVRELFKDTATPGHPGRALLVVDEWAYGYVNEPGGKREPDWPATLNQDRSPAALKAFRDYLKKQYRDLPALNAAWEADFKDWEQVEPYLFTGRPEKAPPEKVWPSIVDYLAFSQQGIADYLATMAAAAKESNPRNRLSASAFYTLGMFTGVDHYLWARHAPHIVVYYDWQVWNSFADEPIGRWFGYGVSLRDPMQERFRAWKHLLREIEGASWSREETFFRPDHTPNEAAAAYYEELRRAKDDGLINLIRAGRSVNEIGILYHPRSYFVHSLKDWTARSDLWWKQVFRRKKTPDYLGRYVEEGLKPWESRFVAMDQIARNEYGRFPRPKMIILPLTEALSDAEVAALRRFAEEGGVLVGDLNTGVRLPAGQKRGDGRGALDDLFGITRREYVEKVTATPAPWNPTEDLPLNFRSHDETQQAVDDVWPISHAHKAAYTLRFADGTVTGTPVLGGALELAGGATAQAALPNGSPAFIVNAVGKGKTVYLNYIPWDDATYDRLRVVAGIPLQKSRVEEGDERIIEAVRELEFDGQLFLGVLTRIWGFGYRWNVTPEQQAYRQSLPTRISALNLKDKAHVYDSRRGKYLGFVDTIPVKFSPEWVADLFAALPYQVRAVEVKAALADEGGAPVIDFELAVRTEGNKAGTHILSVAVLNPLGQPVPSYAQRMTAQHGAARGRIWLAENDPKGSWTLRVRDAATGVHGEAKTP